MMNTRVQSTSYRILKVCAGGSYVVKRHHLLNLGPHLFENALGLFKDTHKTKERTESGVGMATKHQKAIFQSEPTQGEGELPASGSTARPFFQKKERPHHVLLAPNVYGEVTNVKEIKNDKSHLVRLSTTP